MAEVFSAPDGIELRLFSPTGELFAILSDSNLSGEILNVELSVLKFGGLDKFTFQLPRNNDLPISKNTEVYFYVNTELWYNGFVKEAPQPDQYEPILTIQGSGFYKRLEDKIVDIAYSNETLANIIDDIGLNYLGSDIGVFYEGLKIDVPSIPNITIEFKDNTLLQVFKRLLDVANNDYENAKYIFYVDTDKEINFELLSNDLVANYFEGFQYQAPEVSEDTSNLLNQILAYRTKAAAQNEVEFVNTYESVPSQSENGLYNKKIVFPDYLDTTTIANICNFLLRRYENPQKRVAIKDFELNNKLQFGEYLISNRRDAYWFVGAKMDTLDGWDTSAFINSTVELASDHLLTRKQILKFTVGAGSAGEFIEYTLPAPVTFAYIGRIFIYFSSSISPISIIFTDENGAEARLEFAVSYDDLLIYDGVSTDTLSLNDSFKIDDMTIGYSLSALLNEWIKFKDIIETSFTDIIQNLDVFNGTIFDSLDVDDGSGQDSLDVSGKVTLTEIVKTKILINTDEPAVFYIDRVDLLSNAYNSNSLQLEQINYNLRSSQLFADMHFGEREDNVLDELKQDSEAGDIALNIFAKR